MPEIITINQDSDTPARVERFPVGRLTYLYDRSADSRRGGAPGQDFIAFSGGADWLTFTLCDGVSQSFYGDLAARFLGERLTGWLADLAWETLPDDLGTLGSRLGEQLNQTLRLWTKDATDLVAEKPISDLLPGMVRDALERKREVGSESMFVAGRIDMSRWVLVVCWMGDMRLWLWDADNQPFELPDSVWETRERWSSKHGPKNGLARVAVVPLERVARITAHSDGVGSRAPELQWLTPERLDQLAEDLRAQPASDDISILDVWLTPEPLNEALPAPTFAQPDPDEPILHWTAVEGAEWYRVQVRQKGIWVRTIDTHSPNLILPGDLRGEMHFQVQAMSAERAPGELSSAISLKLPVALPPKPPPAVSIPSAPTVRAPASSTPSTVPEVSGAKPVSVFQPVSASALHGGTLNLLAVLLALLLSIGWIYLNVGTH